MKLICIPFPMESISLLFYELLFNGQLHTETKSKYRAILSPTSCSWVFERFEVFYPHWVVQSLLPDRTWRSAEYIRMRSLKIAYQRFAGPRIKKIANINPGIHNGVVLYDFLTIRRGYHELFLSYVVNLNCLCEQIYSHECGECNRRCTSMLHLYSADLPIP